MRRKSFYRGVIATAAAAPALCGCAGSIDDIKFISIAPANLQRHLIAGPMDRPLDRSDLGVLLRVQFTSNRDIRSYVKKYEPAVTEFLISLCPFDEKDTFGPAKLYHNDISLSLQPEKFSGLSANEEAEVRAEDSTSDNSSKQRIYDVYFHYGYLWHFDPVAHQDIRRPIKDRPRDLCFRVVGTPYFWGGFKSNVGLVPHADLATALGVKH